MNILFERENLWASGMFQAGWAATGTWVMRISNPQVHWLFYLELKNLEIGCSYNVRGRGRGLCWILFLFRSLLCCRFTSLEDYGNMSLKIQEKDAIQAYICKQDLKDGLLSTVFSLWSLCAFVITILNSLEVKMYNQFRSKIVRTYPIKKKDNKSNSPAWSLDCSMGPCQSAYSPHCQHKYMYLQESQGAHWYKFKMR